MANIDELLEQASEIRDANEEKENTALRVGTMLVGILQYIAGFIDRETLRQILQEYASLSGTGLVNWRQSRCVFLATMGTELDNIDGGKWEYTSHDGDIVFDPSSRTLRIAGEVNTYFPAPGVIYVNAHTGHLYKWDVSAQKMTELVDSSSPTVIDYRNAPAFADIPIGATYYFLSQSSGYKIGVKVDANNYCSFAIDPKKVYAFRDTRQTAVWNADTQTWTPISGRVINDLTTGGEGDALSAEQGKELKRLIDNISTGRFSIVDGQSDSILTAASSRMVKEIYLNLQKLFDPVNGLANIAFVGTRPNWQSVAIPTHTITLGTMTNVAASLNGTAISGSTSASEGEVTIKLTPAQGAMILTDNISIKLGTEDVPFTTAADNGSTLVTFILAGDIVISASASSGRNIIFTGSAGCSIGAAGVAIGQDLDTTITANEHFTLPASITVKIGNTNVTHTYTRAQDNKTATLHIDAANITGDLTITCTAVEEAHAVLNLTNVGSGATVNKANNAHVYVGDTITIMPASGNKVDTASATVGGNAVTLNGNAYDGYTYTIGSGDVSNNGTAIAITAAGSALQTFSIDLSGVTSDVGVTWNTPSAAVSTILEGSPFSVTLAKVSGAGVLNISTSTMGSETLAPNNGTIATDHVADDITIAASVAAARMKVHSYAYPATSDSLGDCLADTEGGFNLYKYNSTTASTFTNGGSANNGNAAFQDSWYGNGKSAFLHKSGSVDAINIQKDSDFTLIFKDWRLSYTGSTAYNSKQLNVPFFDEQQTNSINEALDATGRFSISVRNHSGSPTYINSGNLGFPLITYVSNGAQSKTFASSNSGSWGNFADVQGVAHDVIVTYDSTNKKAKAWVAKVINGTKTLKLTGEIDVPELDINCIQMPADNSLISGLDIYNYAMTEQEAAIATNSVIS